MLLNAPIQQDFDYTCTSYGTQCGIRGCKTKIQSSETKCIRFYLNLTNTAGTGWGYRIQSYKLAPNKEQNRSNVTV